jgi:hypothetical protein
MRRSIPSWLHMPSLGIPRSDSRELGLMTPSASRSALASEWQQRSQKQNQSRWSGVARFCLALPAWEPGRPGIPAPGRMLPADAFCLLQSVILTARRSEPAACACCLALGSAHTCSAECLHPLAPSRHTRGLLCRPCCSDAVGQPGSCVLWRPADALPRCAGLERHMLLPPAFFFACCRRCCLCSRGVCTEWIRIVEWCGSYVAECFHTLCCTKGLHWLYARMHACITTFYLVLCRRHAAQPPRRRRLLHRAAWCGSGAADRHGSA